MDPQQQWIVNDAGLIYESLDGEVIIIQPETGYYFSLDPVASGLWSVLQQGASVATLSALLPPPDGGDPAADCAAFVQALAEESLVVPGSAAPAAAPAPPLDLLAYSAPRLQKYTDMEEFFLLDPIHEIDDAGWPVAPSDGAPETGPAPA